MQLVKVAERAVAVSIWVPGMFGGKEALERADKAALSFLQNNKGALSNDFFALLGREAGGIVRDFRWAYGGTQTGLVTMPAIDPIDIIGPALFKGIGELIKGAGTGISRGLEMAIAKGTVSSLLTANAKTMAIEGIENALKNLAKTELGQGIAATEESVTKKLMTYLLDLSHPEGGSKAKWFKEALGFTKENAGGLAKQIIFDVDKALPKELTKYGQKYEQLIPIHGANGRTIITQFNWIKNDDGIIRLVGAILTRR